MCLLTQPDLSRAMSGQGKVICTETADQNQTCLWILGSVQSHRAKDRLLSRWRKCHIPLKWASLGWKPCVSSPDDPRPRLYLCRGESWSWVFCLPARILGSQVGVARQAHHSALGCFAFGVKREAQMRRHCHSGDLWPEQWDTGDRHWRGELSYVSVIFQQILKSFVSALVQNTVWGFNIGSQSHVFEFTLQISAYGRGSMMSTYYVLADEKRPSISQQSEGQLLKKSEISEEVWREAVTTNLLAPFIFTGWLYWHDHTTQTLTALQRDDRTGESLRAACQ